jgi:hypothetical protein
MSFWYDDESKSCDRYSQAFEESCEGSVLTAWLPEGSIRFDYAFY